MAISGKQQILKELKDQLMQEFNDKKRLDFVILTLAKKKDLRPEDIDGAREMMRSKRGVSNSILKYGKGTNTLEVDIKNNTQSNLYQSEGESGNRPKVIKHARNFTLPEITPRGEDLQRLPPSKPQILKPDLSYIRTLDLGHSVATQEGQSPRAGEKFDVWHAIVENDFNRFQKEKVDKTHQKKHNQAELKSFLEKQMEQVKAQQQLNNQLEQEEAALIRSRVQQLTDRENYRYSSKRVQLKHLMDENNTQTVNHLIQQKMDKIRVVLEEKEQVEQQVKLDLQEKREEILQAKMKQKKVVTDLDFLKAQNQLVRQFKQKEGHSLNVSPRISLNQMEIPSNPFVDKSDIVRHNNKIQQFVKRNDQKALYFEKYTVSPKDETINHLQLDSNFQAMMDEKNLQNQQRSKNFQKQVLEENHNLQYMKEQRKVQLLKQQLEFEKSLTDIDNQQSSRIKEKEIYDKQAKKTNFKNNLEEQLILKRQKQKEHEQGVTPFELALNKEILQSAHVDEKQLIINKSGVKL